MADIQIYNSNLMKYFNKIFFHLEIVFALFFVF